MTEESQHRLSRSARTPSKYVSQAFGFLKTYDDEPLDIEDAEEVEIKDSIVSNNNFSGEDNDETIDKVQKELTEHKVVDSEDQVVEKDKFTIVTYVDKETENEKETDVEGVYEHGENGSKVIEINPVYEVTEDDMHELEAKMSDNSRLSEPEVNVEDATDVVDTEESARHSVVVEGEVVELRQSEAEKRISRQVTWKVNQKLVSEAFEFLKDEGDLTNLEDDQSEKTDTAVNEWEENGEKAISKGNNRLDNGTSNSETKSDAGVSFNGINQVADDVIDELEDSLNMDEDNDNVGEMRKIKRRGKRHSNQSDTSTDDDGDSSDEDKGELVNYTINFG